MASISDLRVGQLVGYSIPGYSAFDAGRHARIVSMTAARVYVEGYDKPLHPGRISTLQPHFIATLEWIERRPKTTALEVHTGYRRVEPERIDLRRVTFDVATLTAIRDDATALLAWVESRSEGK